VEAADPVRTLAADGVRNRRLLSLLPGELCNCRHEAARQAEVEVAPPRDEGRPRLHRQFLSTNGM
jgi:hypothetical protein